MLLILTLFVLLCSYTVEEKYLESGLPPAVKMVIKNRSRHKPQDHHEQSQSNLCLRDFYVGFEIW